MTNLIFNNVNKIYPNGVHAVKDFNLEIEQGDFVVLLGPSGCGKSTVLRMISGLEEITSGSIVKSGVDITNLAPADRNLALVFQNYALYSHMTVYQNIGFSLIVNKATSESVHNRVLDAKEKTNLTKAELRRLPAELSGGQRQRVALGRAITKDTDLLLMDEPLSNLDAKLRGQMRNEIVKLFHELEKTIIYVTHDQLEAMTMATKIVVMDKGVIQQVGHPLKLYTRPANLFVATFLGTPAINLIKGKFNKGHFIDNNGLKIEVKEHKNNKLTSNIEVVLGFRAEGLIAVDEKEADFSAIVDYVEFMGNNRHIFAIYNDQKIVYKAPPELRFNSGEKIHFKFVQSKLLMFDQKTEMLIEGESL